jgi:CheY-like chemotaxis protein
MKTARILVIDDNLVNLKLAADVLECAEYEVLTAEDADEAFSVLRQTLPDLIMMDIALPGMDGLTLTRRLKANPTTRHIAIVALTAFAMKGDDQKAKEAGCDAYITKPIDTRKLPGEISEILQRCKENS